MIREILVYPDPLLSRSSAPVLKMDNQLRELIKDMFETMYEYEGIGLAAPQIGVFRRVIVLDVSPSDESGVPMALVNPEIVGSEEEMVCATEGCLSVPGVSGEVIRPEIVVVQAMNEEGEPVVVRAGGILGRALQHEIDHLDGVLFIDRRVQPPASPESE